VLLVGTCTAVRYLPRALRFSSFIYGIHFIFCRILRVSRLRRVDDYYFQCEEGDSSLDRPEGSSCTDITDEILEEVEVKQEINKVTVPPSAPGSISDLIGFSTNPDPFLGNVRILFLFCFTFSGQGTGRHANGTGTCTVSYLVNLWHKDRIRLK
jgi:hypothetical protein